MTAIRPVRLQLSRRRGFNLQALSLATNGLPAINVARPSRWGNPFKVGDAIWDPINGRQIGVMSAVDAVERYRRLECTPLRSARMARDLRGRNLACWCALDCQACHANVLLEYANTIRCKAVDA